VTDESDDIRLMLARIEQNQGDLFHELAQLRAAVAVQTSRQNSTIADTKKKPAELPTLYSAWPNG
jgi:ribosomal protein L29